MKNITLQIALLIFILLYSRTAFAQAKIGNNINSINSNSLLELESTNKGLLLPRIALTATNSASPLTAFVAGMVVYNTATAGTSPYNVVPGYYYSDGTQWLQVQSAPVQNYDWRKAGNNNPNAISDTTTTIYHMGKVGIGTNSNYNSALLQLNSTTEGFLPPRMTTSQILSITNPPEGLMIYNTTKQCMGYFAKNGTFKCFILGDSAVPVIPGSGASYTSFYNGWSNGSYSVGGASTTKLTHTAGEAFSNNTACSSKYISASGCGGLTTVTGASGRVYNLVNINGQCWTKQNMREIPSQFSYHTPTDWSTGDDSGYFGYFNASVPNGSSGFATTEPASGFGYLYQWSGAMNNSTNERAQGICPTGFHIPSDCEFSYLEHGLGMSLYNQLNPSIGVDSLYIVKNKLISSGNNASQWTGLASGDRSDPCLVTQFDFSSAFNNNGYTYGRYWTSTTASPGYAKERYIGVANTDYAIFDRNKDAALSVRCLKD